VQKVEIDKPVRITLRRLETCYTWSPLTEPHVATISIPAAHVWVVHGTAISLDHATEIPMFAHDINIQPRIATA
jgi:hypothetical protein